MKKKLLLCLIVSMSLTLQSQVMSNNSAAIGKTREWMKKADALFTENKGQIYNLSDNTPNKSVHFMLETPGMKLFLTKTGLAIQYEKMHYPAGYRDLLNENKPTAEQERQREALQKDVRMETWRMNMILLGANRNASVSTEGKSADYINYYNRNVLDVHHYNKVIYHDIYPNIDWVIYNNEEGVKYDFIVYPGGNPADIKMAYSEQESIIIDHQGNLQLKTSLGNYTEMAPKSFQGEHLIETQFKLNKQVVTFELSDYDQSSVLIIDPLVKIWATYYGGTSDDAAYAMATDNQSNSLLTGYTLSTTAIASGGHQNTFGGSVYFDAYVAKFNISGARLWATYYGGTGDDIGRTLATDAAGNIYLAGSTNSTTNIASTGTGSGPGFIAKFNSAGVRQFGSYAVIPVYSIKVDATDNLYIAGSAGATGLGLSGHQMAFGGQRDAFVAKLNSTGVMLWGTYYGGTAIDDGYDVAVDNSNNVYLSGSTLSATAIASGGHDNILGNVASNDAFLVKFSSTGTRLWATYYGGSSADDGYAIACFNSTDVYLAGYTASSTAIALSGHQNTLSGSNDAFLAKFNSSGVLQWATYYGGTGNETGRDVVLDNTGNVFLAGNTQGSANGIAFNGIQNTVGGLQDAFLVKFSSAGVRLVGTYYGGTGNDFGFAAAVGNSDIIYLAGYTQSTTDISFNGFQNTLSGIGDAYLVMTSSVLIPEIQVYSMFNSNPINIPNGTTSVTYNTFGWIDTCNQSAFKTFYIKNTGSAPLTISSVSLTGTGASNYTIASQPAATIAPGDSTSFEVVFDPSISGGHDATVNIFSNDIDESNFTFALYGIGTYNEINLTGNGNTISDGDMTPSTPDRTDFGSTSVCAGSISRSFVIINNGLFGAPLIIDSVIISGTAATDFQLTLAPAGSLTTGSNNSSAFTIVFNATVSGIRNAIVTIYSNDCDEAVYDFAITGLGIDPEIDILGNGVSISDGQTNVSTLNNTDFGSMTACNGSISKVFTIQNVGSSNLTVSGLAFSGSAASDFSISSNPSSTITAGNSASFTVLFNPSATGIRAAMLSMNTNDCDEGVYTFTLNGLGIDPQTADAGADQTICNSAAALIGNLPISGIGTWSQVSGPSQSSIGNLNSPNVNISNMTLPGIYTFAWSITNPNCPVSSDQVQIVLSGQPTQANAGIDLSGCSNNGTAIFNASPLTVGTGTWIQINGPTTAAIQNTSSATSSVSGLTASGIYIFEWTTSNAPCPSSNDIVLINVFDPSTSFLSATSCDSYILNSQTYSQSGIYNQTVTNFLGCDSIITLDLTILPLPAVFGGQDQSVCEGDPITLSASGGDSYSWDNGVSNNSAFTPTHTGDLTYTVTVTDANNCSNTDQLVVTVNEHSTATQTTSDLDTYTWPVNGQTYTQSGVYTATIPNVAGCDSTITLNLTLNFTGITETGIKHFTVYPNPANDVLNVTMTSESNEVYTVLDSRGRKVLEGRLFGTEYKISMKSLSAGAYLLQIGQNEVLIKIIKQ